MSSSGSSVQSATDTQAAASVNLAGLSPRRLAMLLAPLVALTPFAIDTYLPAMPSMAAYFGTSIANISLTISVFLIGYAIGQLVGGPLSELWGRQRFALFGLLVFTACSIGITQTETLPALITLRFFQALSGGFATVVVAAIVRDHFQGKDSARVFSMIGMIMMLAPLTAPAVGSLMLAWFPWQGIFFLLSLYAVVMLLLVGFKLPKQAPRTGPKPPLLRHFIDSYGSAFAQRASFRHLFAQACVSGIMFTFLTSIPFIFMGHFGLDEQVFPFYFAALIGTTFIVNPINLRLLKHFSRLNILRGGISLQLLCTTSFALCSYFGFTGIENILPLMMIVVGCIGFIFSNNLSMYLDYHHKSAASANALFGCSTFAAGAILGSITGVFHDGTLLPIGIVVFCGNAVGFLLVWTMRTPPEGEAVV